MEAEAAGRLTLPADDAHRLMHTKVAAVRTQRRV